MKAGFRDPKPVITFHILHIHINKLPAANVLDSSEVSFFCTAVETTELLTFIEYLFCSTLFISVLFLVRHFSLRIGNTCHRLVDARIPLLPGTGDICGANSKANWLWSLDESLFGEVIHHFKTFFSLGIRGIRFCIASLFATTYRHSIERRR